LALLPILEWENDFDIKCQEYGFKPMCAVIVATI